MPRIPHSRYRHAAVSVLWIAVFITRLSVAWGQSPESEQQESLRVATYNVRNYLLMERVLEGQFREDYPKPEREKDVVRQIIRKADPDILALQEIGSWGMLEELRSDLAREGLSYEGAALLEADDERRRVAALWKENLAVHPVEHRDLDFELFGERYWVKRGMLELRVGEETDPAFSLFVLHLKSRYTDDPRDPSSQARRTGEARAARNRILELFPKPEDGRFLIAGDLNDQRHSSAVRRFLRRGEVEISRLTDLRDEHGLIWTHFYHKGGEYSLIDYILVSPGLEQRASLSGGIDNSPDYYEGSDHRLVWVDLSWPADELP